MRGTSTCAVGRRDPSPGFIGSGRKPLGVEATAVSAHLPRARGLVSEGEVLGVSHVEPEAAREARFAFDEKTVTAHAEGAVGFLASLGEGCGSPGTWERGVARDVGGAGCPALGQRPIADCPADYDLVSVTATELRFGDRPADNDMCSPERRPTAVSGLASIRQ